MWVKFDSKVARRSVLPSPTADCTTVELRRYFELLELSRDVDPIKWWLDQSTNFRYGWN